MADENKTTKKRHVIDPHCGKKFSAEYQPSPEAKSRGMHIANARKKLFEDLSEGLLKVNAPQKAIDGAMNNLALGDPKPMIELLKMIKLPDKQEMELTGNVQVMPTVKIDGKELEIKIGDDPNVGTSENT